MLNALIKTLEAGTRKAIRAHGLHLYKKRKQRQDFAKRTGLPAKVTPNARPVWALNDQFNPFKVRKKTGYYCRLIAKAIAEERYSPLPALNLRIPKPDGRRRTISQYACTDAAVAKWLYTSLMAKNESRFSNHAYAFRTDRNALMAARHIIHAAQERERSFLVEFDFKNFFDEISHRHLFRILDTHFPITAEERAAVKGFVQSRYALDIKAYNDSRFKPRLSGIPQGSTISLFLANAVCFELDRELDGLSGTKFARFADDIVAICNSYEQACETAAAIHRFSRSARVPINIKKSDGISLLSQIPGEIRTKTSFEFLGYSISQHQVCLSLRRKKAIKRSLSQIVYETLLKQLKVNVLSPKRIQQGADWDFVVCLNQIRRRIYGRGISENDLSLPITPSTRAPFSLVSHHALVTSDVDFVELDGWLLGSLSRALGLRHHLARRNRIKFSRKLSRKNILGNSWYNVPSLTLDTRLASLTRSWLYARKFFAKRGPSKFSTFYPSY